MTTHNKKSDMCAGCIKNAIKLRLNLGHTQHLFIIKIIAIKSHRLLVFCHFEIIEIDTQLNKAIKITIFVYDSLLLKFNYK